MLKFFISIFCLTTLCLFGIESDASRCYLERRLPLSNKRYPTMLFCLKLLAEREAKILIETGTARKDIPDFIDDGGSTIVFSDWALKNHAHFFSVDIDPQAIQNAARVIQERGKNTTLICSDSISFLQHLSYPIDFLYLDSFDYDMNNPLPSQLHHLKEIVAAFPHLHSNSVVMIDDCDLPNGGKGLLAIKFLLSQGWKIAMQGYQVVLTP